jgi:small-conductance mechanosensitive channel
MYTQVEKFLNLIVFGNSILRYLVTAFVFAVGMVAIKLGIRRFVQRIKKLAKKTMSTFNDFLVNLLESIILPLLYLVVMYLSLKSLVFPRLLERALNYIILGVVVFFAVRVLIAFIGYGFKIYLKKQGGGAALEKSLQGAMVVIKLVVWAGAVIFFLDNLGFKISAVIAGLGIGGVAIALAAQTILKDLFSYFCILFDHPFKAGDFIIIGDFMGTIEYIGIKTTRIRSLGGEMLIFSNSDLTDSRLRNYKLMEKRRVLFRIGVTYQTTLGQLKEIPKIIENIIKNAKDTLFDRTHFFSYGDFSLIFEVVYYVIGPDYNKYMDIQQEINFAIKDEFEKRGIEFAYPTQTVFVTKAV